MDMIHVQSSIVECMRTVSLPAGQYVHHMHWYRTVQAHELKHRLLQRQKSPCVISASAAGQVGQ